MGMELDLEGCETVRLEQMMETGSVAIDIGGPRGLSSQTGEMEL